jgi:hypothetical protein
MGKTLAFLSNSRAISPQKYFSARSASIIDTSLKASLQNCLAMINARYISDPLISV